MSRTEDNYRLVDARRKGYVAGLFDDPQGTNPYKSSTGTYLAWLMGWEDGQKGHKRMTQRKVTAA